MRRRAGIWLFLVAVVVTGLVRWPLLTRQGLWVDEVFSLALATGHSLEHPPSEALAARGDFMAGRAARPAEEWGAYLRHDSPPAGPERVLRAAFLSDTNPPLYYLSLWAWTRALGTSDAVLRGFSLACALACLPFLRRLARWSGGPPAVLPAFFLFALTPLSVYYGTEGRMYAFLWLWVVAFAWSTVVVRARGSARAWLAWSALGAGGFLTHYFFAFVWGGLTLFLLLRPGRATRRALVPAALLTGVLVLPWYARLAESLGRWRVTQDWLATAPEGFSRPRAALELAGSLFSGSAPLQWGEHRLARSVALALFALLGLVLLCRARGFPRPGTLLALLWLGAAGAGPLVFDALRGTFTVTITRYALPGFPAAVLLAAVALVRLRPPVRAAFLAGLCLAWAPHFDLMLRRYSRSWCPLREVARGLDAPADEDSLVLVHSIPSGLLGIARYCPGRVELAAWFEALGPQPLPATLEELAPGKERIVLVRVHEVGAPCPLEDWLRTEALLVAEMQREGARVLTFRPRVAGGT